MNKSILLSLGLATASLLAPAVSRADYSNTVMSFNPIAYWPLNETNQPPPAATTATNLGTFGVAGNGKLGGLVFAIPGALPGDSDKAADLSSATVTTPYS